MRAGRAPSCAHWWAPINPPENRKGTPLRESKILTEVQLGHASIATTLNIYTHVVDASHRKAIEALERESFPTVPKSPTGGKAADSASADSNAG